MQNGESHADACKRIVAELKAKEAAEEEKKAARMREFAEQNRRAKEQRDAAEREKERRAAEERRAKAEAEMKSAARSAFLRHRAASEDDFEAWWTKGGREELLREKARQAVRDDEAAEREMYRHYRNSF
jgi:hypothetical protein